MLLAFFNNAVCRMTVVQEQSCIDFGETNTRRPRGPFPSAPFCRASDPPVGIAYVADDFFVKPGVTRSQICLVCAWHVEFLQSWWLKAWGDGLKTTLSFYQPGVPAGLCKGGDFLSKTRDSHFLCLAYDLFLKTALTRISCKWPVAS